VHFIEISATFPPPTARVSQRPITSDLHLNARAARVQPPPRMIAALVQNYVVTFV
jgi:hypothetical protein